MKAIRVEGKFGLDQLTAVELPDPVAGPGEVLVRVHAVSLNYRDLLMVKGFYNPKQRLPLIPCSDGAGVVVAVGPGVERVAVGDKVTNIFAPRWESGPPSREKLAETMGGPADGMVCELRALPERAVLASPSHLSFEEAATLPCAAVTAWRALVTEGHLQAGQTVLVQGTGGVSLFALQIARLHGAKVIVTSSQDAKLARAMELGATERINYQTTPLWSDEVKRLTGKLGVDHVIEVGGAGTLEQSLRAVRFGGQVSIIGVLAGAGGPMNLLPVLMQHIRLQGILVGCREDFQALNRAFAAQGTRPAIDRVFDDGLNPAQLRAAFEHMQEGRHFGKIVLRLGR